MSVGSARVSHWRRFRRQITVLLLTISLIFDFQARADDEEAIARKVL